MSPKESKQKKQRNYPSFSLEECLPVSQKIADEMGGKAAFKRLLLADALGIKPSSSNFKMLLSSSYKYGLTDGTEKASEIKLTPLGEDVTQTKDMAKRKKGLIKAAMTPAVFVKFYNDYSDKKLPSEDMFRKILASEYGVPEDRAQECAEMIKANGRLVSIIRDIGGSPHVILDVEESSEKKGAPETEENNDDAVIQEEIIPDTLTQAVDDKIKLDVKEPPKAIFIGHGKKKTPLQKLQKILTSFQIPHKLTIDEANLGRPIPQKVKDTMTQCGSAILIFTCDEKFFDEQGNAIWRPSENVVHELGAASFAYGDRVVIFKEKGLHFPSNYQSIGYIEFDEDSIEAKTAELLKELIGFGLVKITPT